MKFVELCAVGCLSLVLSGCSDDGANDVNMANEVADSGGGVEVDSGADANAADPCQPGEQFWNLTEERFIGNEGVQDLEGTAPVEEAGPESTGAVVRNGELIIKTQDDEMPPIGFVRMTLGLRPSSGDLPGTHDFTKLLPDIDPLADFPEWWEGTYFYYSVVTEYVGNLPSSTGANLVDGGTVTLETCPNEVGQWAIGSIDATIGQAFIDEGTMEGDFAIVVYESDGSLECGEPVLCDY